MIRNRKWICVWALLLAIALCSGGCESVGGAEQKETSSDQQEKAVEKEITDIDEQHLRDRDALYANEDDTSVVTMYLTVQKGNSSENTNHTWEEINTYSAYDYDAMGVERYQAAALLQVGDEKGPSSGEVGYGETTPNATVQVRGQTSSRNQQKSYKIELKKNKGNWRGQRTINLNKHQTDGLRFRNKLAYDLIEGIPQMMGLRTQFVHLYVKDESVKEGGVFRDYGLYTQVEQLNKTGLRAHGLDSNGQLYKINFFEFYRYEEVIMPEDDPKFDPKKFEELLEIKGNHDHTKLIEMLEAVNDNSQPIEKVLEQYFDRENLAWWMAFQILTGNVDTQSRNMYLYSPQNGEKWYFISWDSDASFMNTEYKLTGFVGKGSWESGISNYWGNVLFQRCLKSEAFRKTLDEAIQELRTYLSEERLTAMIADYKKVTTPFVTSMPDNQYENLTADMYEQVAAAVPKEVEENYRLYLESLEKPMPFFIGAPQNTDGTLHLVWDGAYDFDAEDITYTVEVAKDCLFQEVIWKTEHTVLPEANLAMPEAGQYFVRVRAVNESGETQDAFDYYVTDEGKQFGTKCFYVRENGTIEEDVYEE